MGIKARIREWWRAHFPLEYTDLWFHCLVRILNSQNERLTMKKLRGEFGTDLNRICPVLEGSPYLKIIKLGPTENDTVITVENAADLLKELQRLSQIIGERRHRELSQSSTFFNVLHAAFIIMITVTQILITVQLGGIQNQFTQKSVALQEQIQKLSEMAQLDIRRFDLVGVEKTENNTMIKAHTCLLNRGGLPSGQITFEYEYGTSGSRQIDVLGISAKEYKCYDHSLRGYNRTDNISITALCDICEISAKKGITEST